MRGLHTSTSSLIAQYGFAIVALIIVTGELGLPVFVPGEIALLVAGGVLVHHIPALLLAIALFGLLDFAATTTLHLVARTGGNRALRFLLRRYRGDDGGPVRFLDAWRRRVGARDALVIFVMRFVPVVRMYASLVSGLVRIPLGQFVAGALPAAFIWTAIPLTAGYALQNRTSTVQHHYGEIVNGIVVLLGVVGVIAVAHWYRQRRANPPHHSSLP